MEETELQKLKKEVQNRRALGTKIMSAELKQRIVEYLDNSNMRKLDLEKYLELSNGIISNWQRAMGVYLPRKKKSDAMKKALEKTGINKPVENVTDEIIELKANGIEIKVKQSQLAFVLKTFS